MICCPKRPSWITKQYILQRLYRWVHFELILLMVSQYLLIIAYVDSKTKWNIFNKKNKVLFIPFISHATTQNRIWIKFLNIMIVPCNWFLLLEQSVSAVLAHTFWTLVEFTAFFLSLSVIQTEQFPCRLLSASFTIAVKLIVSKAHPILSFPRSMFEQISAISPSY